MLNDATCFHRVYIVCGYTDLRSGIDTLVSIVAQKTDNSPYVPDTLYLFCGRSSNRIKGIVWEKDGFLLLYKRLEKGRFIWPRNADEVRALTPQMFRWLMEGLTIEPKKVVREVSPPEYMA
jgi:transposase